MGAKIGLLLLGSFLSILGIMLVITSRSPDRNILTRVLVEIMDLFPWPRITARTNAHINGVGLLAGGFALLIWFLLALVYPQLSPASRH